MPQPLGTPTASSARKDGPEPLCTRFLPEASQKLDCRWRYGCGATGDTGQSSPCLARPETSCCAHIPSWRAQTTHVYVGRPGLRPCGRSAGGGGPRAHAPPGERPETALGSWRVAGLGAALPASSHPRPSQDLSLSHLCSLGQKPGGSGQAEGGHQDVGGTGPPRSLSPQHRLCPLRD